MLKYDSSKFMRHLYICSNMTLLNLCVLPSSNIIEMNEGFNIHHKLIYQLDLIGLLVLDLIGLLVLDL